MPPIATKNLGFIKAIHKSVNAPLNTAMIWYDDNIGQKIHKYYDVVNAIWVPFAAGTNVITASSYGQMKFIPSNTNVNVNQNFQYWIYGDLTIEGVLDNSGEVIIANGALVLQNGGTFNNIGSGTITLQNLSTGDNMYVIKKTLTAAQLKTGNSIPIDSGIPLPGVGLAIEVISASVKYTANDGLLSLNDILLNIDTAPNSQFSAESTLTPTADTFILLVKTNITVDMSGTLSNIVENKALTIMTNSDSGAGTGTADVYITYRLVKL